MLKCEVYGLSCHICCEPVHCKDYPALVKRRMIVDDGGQMRVMRVFSSSNQFHFWYLRVNLSFNHLLMFISTCVHNYWFYISTEVVYLVCTMQNFRREIRFLDRSYIGHLCSQLLLLKLILMKWSFELCELLFVHSHFIRYVDIAKITRIQGRFYSYISLN